MHTLERLGALESRCSGNEPPSPLMLIPSFRDTQIIKVKNPMRGLTPSMWESEPSAMPCTPPSVKEWKVYRFLTRSGPCEMAVDK